MIVSLRILIKIELSKTLINSRVVQHQNEHNNENQRKYLDRELYKYYCLDLHKRLNSSRHHVHYLAE
jgi:hypothetical protein